MARVDEKLVSLDKHRRAVSRFDWEANREDHGASRFGQYFVGLMAYWRHQDDHIFGTSKLALSVQALMFMVMGVVLATDSRLSIGEPLSWLILIALAAAIAVQMSLLRTSERSQELRDLCEIDLCGLSTFLVAGREAPAFETLRRGVRLPTAQTLIGLIRLSVAANVVGFGVWLFACSWRWFDAVPALYTTAAAHPQAALGLAIVTPFVLAQLFVGAQWAGEPFYERAVFARWRGDSAAESIGRAWATASVGDVTDSAVMTHKHSGDRCQADSYVQANAANGPWPTGLSGVQAG